MDYTETIKVTTYDLADLIEKHQLPNDDPLTEETTGGQT